MDALSLRLIVLVVEQESRAAGGLAAGKAGYISLDQISYAGARTTAQPRTTVALAASAWFPDLRPRDAA